MIRWITALLIASLVLVACGSNANAGDSAAGAVSAYINARNSASASDLQALSCKAWESGAGDEANSFKSMSARVSDLACQQTGTDGQYTLVKCQGTLTTTYNGENRTRDLSTRLFRAAQESGSWKMCGYQGGS
ncbi:MAG TPA: hypothetical protein VMT34_17075 [Aggregatilineales bacterium]|nr:hypothetical protein [Aggregatilineales bacterium]